MWIAVFMLGFISGCMFTAKSPDNCPLPDSGAARKAMLDEVEKFIRSYAGMLISEEFIEELKQKLEVRNDV